jgi:hypothetical protein
MPQFAKKMNPYLLALAACNFLGAVQVSVLLGYGTASLDRLLPDFSRRRRPQNAQ